nr:MAG TPA: hypothetical protein [Caudoviricetes sp.]
MSVTDWKMQKEWQDELANSDVRRIQNPIYYDKAEKTTPLTNIEELKKLKSKQYDEALIKIDFHIKANFLNGDKVSIYQALLPDNVKIDDNELHERIKKQGYTLKVVYGLVGEVDCLEISGW